MEIRSRCYSYRIDEPGKYQRQVTQIKLFKEHAKFPFSGCLIPQCAIEFSPLPFTPSSLLLFPPASHFVKRGPHRSHFASPREMDLEFPRRRFAVRLPPFILGRVLAGPDSPFDELLLSFEKRASFNTRPPVKQCASGSAMRFNCIYRRAAGRSPPTVISRLETSFSSPSKFPYELRA